MPSLSSMPAFRTEGVVDSCRVSMVRLALIRRREPRGEGRGALPAETRSSLCAAVWGRRRATAAERRQTAAKPPRPTVSVLAAS